MSASSTSAHLGAWAPSLRRILAGTGKYTSLVLWSLVMVVPLAVVILTALKTPQEVATKGAFAAPDNWLNLDNFATAFSKGNMLVGLFNTAIILTVSVAGTVILGTMTAYAIDRFDFRGKKLVMSLFLLATLVPGITTQVATFQIVNNLGVYDTRWAPILLYLGTDIVAIYIFLQFIRGIPVSLDEAARLDGATPFGIYWRVILPLLRPAIATVVIIKGTAIYNDFYIPFLYMPSDDKATISTALFRFKGPMGSQWEVISAGTLLVIVPTLLVFLGLQRFTYNGFTSGAVK